MEYPQIDRRSQLSIKEFRQEYRKPGKPVVITDAMDGWNARSAWTFDFFKSRFGSDPVKTYRYQGDKYRPDAAIQMQLADYIDAILTQDWDSFPYYIRDNWALLTAHPELAVDYRFPKYFFDWFTLLPGFLRLPYPRIFIGPKGALTPLHQDIWGTHAWLSQLVGRKRWILIPPDQANLLYDHRVQPDGPDFERFPLFRKATPIECTLRPGETIFVPSQWHHWVVSLDPTISLTSNYMGPGCFAPSLTNAIRELLLKRAWNASSRWFFKPRPRVGTN